MSRQLFQYDPLIGYRFIPQLQARVPHEGGGYLVQTNSDGFRCRHNFVAGKPPGIQRILLFGDSFTAGDGVPAAQRFGDQLEQLLPGTEVYNFGIPGTGTDQHYLLWQHYSPRIQHDLVILAVQPENIRRVTAKYRHYQDEQGRPALYEKPYFVLEDGKLELKNCPPGRKPRTVDEIGEGEEGLVDNAGPLGFARAIVNAIGVRELAQKLTRFQPLPEYSDPQHPGWLVMSRLIAEITRRETSPVVLTVPPLYHYVEDVSDAGDYRQRFQELADQTGAILSDPLPDLWKRSLAERRTFRFPKDIHPTAAGHRALAESLAPAVQGALAQINQGAAH